MINVQPINKIQKSLHKLPISTRRVSGIPTFGVLWEEAHMLTHSPFILYSIYILVVNFKIILIWVAVNSILSSFSLVIEKYLDQVGNKSRNEVAQPIRPPLDPFVMIDCDAVGPVIPSKQVQYSISLLSLYYKIPIKSTFYNSSFRVPVNEECSLLNTISMVVMKICVYVYVLGTFDSVPLMSTTNSTDNINSN
ncbi:uncharacterized protein BX664DRAFT_382073 [Halteromyces radiatus]|uniref:uncharacterized protein n=1 Tax=Halteromyces radiatus TaxID=101107 RepID=UPI00221F7306|nr:uncharacterized protein BX664DRAFT_382073 [Halteromyces radiatus]KAI8099548.1 hypothetical protein BX664DRAFT_382073 [Halteromyces radiatus]